MLECQNYEFKEDAAWRSQSTDILIVLRKAWSSTCRQMSAEDRMRPPLSLLSAESQRIASRHCLQLSLDCVEALGSGTEVTSGDSRTDGVSSMQLPSMEIFLFTERLGRCGNVCR